MIETACQQAHRGVKIPAHEQSDGTAGAGPTGSETGGRPSFKGAVLAVLSPYYYKLPVSVGCTEYRARSSMSESPWRPRSPTAAATASGLKSPFPFRSDSRLLFKGQRPAETHWLRSPTSPKKSQRDGEAYLVREPT